MCSRAPSDAVKLGGALALVLALALVIGAVWWASERSSTIPDAALPDAPSQVHAPRAAEAAALGAPPASEPTARVAEPVAPSLAPLVDTPRAVGTVLVRATWNSPAAPAAGLAVRLVARDTGYPPLGVREARTDARGEARFERVPAGAVELACDRQRVAGQVEPESAWNAELKLERGLQLRGRTIDPAGRAVAHAELFLLCADSDVPLLATESDNSGQFRLFDVALGSRVFARAKDRSPSRPYAVDGNAEAGFEHLLTLGERGANLLGQVLDENEAPVAGAAVCVEHAGSPPALTESDREGRFVLNGLEPGSARLLVRFAALAPHDEALELGWGGRDERIVRLAAGRSVGGRAFDEAGAPLAGLELSWRSASSTLEVRTISAADGSFGLRGVPVGRQRLYAGDWGFEVEVEELGATTWNPILPQRAPEQLEARPTRRRGP